ncbi:MAG TPA: outer membrane beta-barrel protein [Puia sp.]|nr:outer membrane beta-barrel protein [Puia sp.]
MYRKIATLVIFVIVCCSSHAQTSIHFIHGAVQDSLSGQSLEDATISLLKLPAASLLHRVRSGKQGFTFRNLSPGQYQLVTSYLGYATDTTAVTLSQTDTTGKRVRILLRQEATAMMEVVVHANIPPAIVKNDTIAFNAGAFPTRPNATVEDLLRKLPGIEVDKNGNITMQGQKIDKIYLDGKEFFLDDPRTATQNLPADIVDQIEAFNSQTERARLTGVQETTGTESLNIRLKKNRKKGYFGKVYAGTGSGGPANPSSATSSYSAGGTATTLGTSWLFGTGNINNMNNQFTGADNKNGPGSGGIQKFDNLQLNFRTDKHKALTFTLNAGTNGTHTTLDQTNQRQTTLTDSSLLENRLSHSVSHNQSLHANAYLEYNIDSFSLVNLRTTVTPSWSGSTNLDTVAIQTSKTQNTYLSNQGRTDNSSHSDQYNITNALNFRQRWRRPGRTLFVNLTQSYEHQDQPQNIFSLVNNFDSSGSLLSRTLTNQTQSQLSKNEEYGASIAYTEPLKPGHLLDFSYRINRAVSRSDRQAFDFDSATGSYDLPNTLTTNHFLNYNTIQRIGAGYNATEGKYRYQLGVTLQFSDLDDHNLTAKTLLNQRQTNWYPRASLIYTPSRGKNIKVVYTANTTSPTIQQLQPLPDLTNPFLVRIGNPDLLQQLTHNVKATYTNFNGRNFRNLQIGLQGNFIQHEITPSTTILAGGIQQIQYINVDGVWHASSNITYGFPLGDQRKGNSSIGVRFNYGRDVSLLNGVQDVNSSFGWGGTWKLNFHPVEKMFVEAVAGVNYTNTQYSVDPGQNTNTWLQNYSVDASYELPGAITIASNYNLQITGPQGSLPSRSVALWNASVSKDLLRNRSAQIRFSAFGLLNTVSNYTQTIGINYKETSQTNLPGRIFLLSFIYRFRHFPAMSRSHQPS